MTTKKSHKIPINYKCIKCGYNTSNKADYDKHLLTRKHINTTNTTNKSQKIDVNYICIKCGKSYPYRASLYNHNKKCSIIINKDIQIINNDANEEEINYKEMFLILINQLTEQNAQNKELQNTFIEQNKELHNTIIELIPKIGNNIINNNTNNVSIQVFLNDTCKDAMSLTDFIDTIQVNVADLLFTKENGLVKGISNLFLSNLERLPMIQRPLWCSDKKRKGYLLKTKNIG